ncbi:hypothetical protein CLV30_12847 [Haloactinopolyspora alba]|uniref:50S ribosomal protein L29 n=1 Tax=Haloactinopolyspora alba TaxID=648780 RepID=A0A2P8DEZ6_9ACTN|nr:hypothetical protein [Haloactinopolyspora alba]PSK95795.1 hypothetical protein CLV30_12847 [Haloactinopolyspora alba]
MPQLEDLTLDDLIREFKRQRWIALEKHADGRDATGSLTKAVALRDRIRELGGKVPF